MANVDAGNGHIWGTSLLCFDTLADAIDSLHILINGNELRKYRLIAPRQM